MDHVIATKQLHFKYGSDYVIQNLDINLHENQLIGLIGRNGSGKTTFMKLCAGLLQPSHGELQVFGQAPENHLEILQNITYCSPGIVHRESNTLERIIDNFALFYPALDRRFADKLMQCFSLSPGLKYKSLSQGMASLFHLICALSTRAKLTMLDEPVTGMDISVRKTIYEIILRDYMEHPRTMIISSHILSELEELLGEILIIASGRVVLYGSTDEIKAMAYRIDGSREAVSAYIKGRSVLHEIHSITGSYAIIHQPYDEKAGNDAAAMNVTVSRVRPEELYVYLTADGKERDLECLWEN